MNNHLNAIEVVCRICAKKRKPDQLRSLDFNENRKFQLLTFYNIDIDDEKQSNWYPQRICTGCCGTLERFADSEGACQPPRLGSLGSSKRRLTGGHDNYNCELCQISIGRVGQPSKQLKLDPPTTQLEEPSDQTITYKIPENNSWRAEPTINRCNRCFAIAIVGHHCNRKNAVENAALMLEEMGIAEEVRITEYLQLVSNDKNITPIQFT